MLIKAIRVIYIFLYVMDLQIMRIFSNFEQVYLKTTNSSTNKIY